MAYSLAKNGFLAREALIGRRAARVSAICKSLITPPTTMEFIVIAHANNNSLKSMRDHDRSNKHHLEINTRYKRCLICATPSRTHTREFTRAVTCSQWSQNLTYRSQS